MGLAIAREILRAHGGDVIVHSREGEGAKFSLSIPMAGPEAEASTESLSGGKKVSAGRILVVDDEPQIRRVMRTTLVANGYEVDDARTAEEALEKLRAGRYDAMLLDVNLGDANGIELCRAIRRERPNLEPSILMLTVRNAEKDKVRRWTPARTITSQNLSARRNCWRGFARRCGACPRARRLRKASSWAARWWTLRAREVTSRGVKTRLTVKELDLLAYMARSCQPHADASRIAAGRLGAGIRRRAGISPRVRQPAAKKN